MFAPTKHTVVRSPLVQVCLATAHLVYSPLARVLALYLFAFAFLFRNEEVDVVVDEDIASDLGGPHIGDAARELKLLVFHVLLRQHLETVQFEGGAVVGCAGSAPGVLILVKRHRFLLSLSLQGEHLFSPVDLFVVGVWSSHALGFRVKLT